jgi:hypothetical protein
MMGVMRCPAAGFFRALVLVAGVCSGQIPQPAAGPSHYIEIKLPRWVNSESVFVRYQLAGEQFGGWVQQHPGVSSYFISTTHEGRPVTRIKALLYARGCAIQTLDLPVSGSNNQQFFFICRGGQSSLADHVQLLLPDHVRHRPLQPAHRDEDWLGLEST